MTDTPVSGNAGSVPAGGGAADAGTANTAATTPTTPASTGGTVAGPSDGGTGNPADAAPTQGNPTDSSAVSDEEGVQPERAAEELRTVDESTEQDDEGNDTPDVDHEGTGPGEQDATPDGSDNA